LEVLPLNFGTKNNLDFDRSAIFWFTNSEKQDRVAYQAGLCHAF